MAVAAFKCEICGKTFEFMSKYERHLKTQLHLDNVKRLECCELVERECSSRMDGLVETASSEATSLLKDDGDNPRTDEGKPVVMM